MNGTVKSVTALVAGMAMTVVGCSSTGLQSWNPISQLMPKTYSNDTKFRVARVQEQQGKLGKAHEIYSELYRRNPENVAVCQRLAIVSTRMGDHRQADRFFKEALRLSPDRADVLADYGYSKLMSRDFKTAESLLRRAVAMQPGNKRAINNLAMTVGYQGKHEQALTLFRRAVSEAQAHANLGYIHAQRGEGKLAVARYTRAIELDKNLRSASHALLQLAEVEQRYLKTDRARKQIAKMKEKKQNRQDTRVAIRQKTKTKAPIDSKVRLTSGRKTRMPLVRQQPTKQVVRQQRAKPRNRRANPRVIRRAAAKTITLPKRIDPAFTSRRPIRRRPIRRRPSQSVAGGPATASSAPFPQNTLERKRKPAVPQISLQRSTSPATGWSPTQTQRTVALTADRATSPNAPATKSGAISQRLSKNSTPKKRPRIQITRTSSVRRSPFAEIPVKTKPDVSKIVVRTSQRTGRVSLQPAAPSSSRKRSQLRSTTPNPTSGRIRLLPASKIQGERPRRRNAGRVRLTPASDE